MPMGPFGRKEGSYMSYLRFVMLLIAVIFVMPVLMIPQADAFKGDSECNEVDGKLNRWTCRLYCDVLDCTKDRPSKWGDRVCEHLASKFERRTGALPPCVVPFLFAGTSGNPSGTANPVRRP